jgi:phospholipid/cholesterol/gamma-HCH transport system substrate-binding protein
MKTYHINHAVIVGFFVIIGLLIFVAAIFYLGGQQKTFAKTITVIAVFDDVNGLQAGDNVWLFGVKVGTVKKVSFYGPARVEVVMLVEIEAKSHLRKDADAKISSDGFIGDKIVVLSGGNQQTPEIQDGDSIHVSSTPGTDQIMTTLQANNLNLLKITRNFQSVSEQLVHGEGMLGQLLNDPGMAKDLQRSMANVKSITDKGELVMADLQQLTSGIRRRGSLPYELSSDTLLFSQLRTTVNNLKMASVSLNSASQHVNVVGDSLQSASVSLNNVKKPIGMLLNDEQVAGHLKMILLNLDSSSKKLDDDLEAAQHNFLLRGFFKKREKKP